MNMNNCHQMGSTGINSLFPEGSWGEWGMYNFKAKFKSASLKIKAKITLVRFTLPKNRSIIK